MTVECSPKELWLFTHYFPHGIEEAYLENELPVLSERFSRVVIFPLLGAGSMRTMPANVEVRHPITDPYARADKRTLLRYAWAVRALATSLWRDLGTTMFKRRWRGELRSRIAGQIHRLAILEHALVPAFDPAHVVLYSYWTHDWATLLALLKKKHAAMRFVTRAHGFDLYEQRQPMGAIPFRSVQLRGLDKLYCVSSAGLLYMKERHPRFAAKYALARLGTSDQGQTGPSRSGPLQVASCAHVVPVKRVALVADALRQVEHPVHWTHFGDGPQMAALREQVATLPEHVTVDLKGSIANADLMEWYRTHPVDAFLLTSELEGGVAVVLQEAASFGIPLIATDSGGVRDIVVPETGVLLPTHPAPHALANLLDGFRDSPMATESFRHGVRRFWETHFKAEVSFHAFCDELIGA